MNRYNALWYLFTVFREVAERMIGKDFAWLLSCDCFLAYDTLPCRQHKCAGHLRRRCAEVQAATTGAAAMRVARLLRGAMTLRERVGEARYQRACQKLEAVLGRLLAGEQTDPANARLVKLLRKHRKQHYTFLYVEGLAPTNNADEREIRPAIDTPPPRYTEQTVNKYHEGVPFMDTKPAVLTPPSPDAKDMQELFRLLSGYRVSQALYVVAKLGIPDLLREGPQSTDDLARTTGTHPVALYRVLRFLTSIGLFTEEAPRRFALTPLGAGLRSDVAGSIRPRVLMLLDDYHWQPWSQLIHSVRTGETAFEKVHGMGLFDYLGCHPDAATLFHDAMTSSTAQSGAAITDAYDFTGIRRIVDIGGGHGLLLATILKVYPDMHGVVFDRPEVVVGATQPLEASGVADRCTLVGGDFFTADLPTGDAYILRQIIHDWDDTKATTILANCRRSITTQGRLLVVERAITPDYHQSQQVLHLDLEMLVNVGGLQRTDEEYDVLFAGAGFRLTNVVPLGDAAQFCVFEGVPA